MCIGIHTGGVLPRQCESLWVWWQHHKCDSEAGLKVVRGNVKDIFYNNIIIAY